MKIKTGYYAVSFLCIMCSQRNSKEIPSEYLWSLKTDSRICVE